MARIIQDYASAELIEKRSRFIGLSYPLPHADLASDCLADARQRFPEARHYVYAYRALEPQVYSRYSDDGEPQGTGGRPLLNVLEKHDIRAGLIVVVRYFGGILLGAGGLLRTYSKAASLVLAETPLAALEQRRKVQVSLPYDQAERFLALLSRQPSMPEPILSYGTAVCFDMGLREEDIPWVLETLQALSAGQAEVVIGDWEEVAVPIFPVIN